MSVAWPCNDIDVKNCENEKWFRVRPPCFLNLNLNLNLNRFGIPLT